MSSLDYPLRRVAVGAVLACATLALLSWRGPAILPDSQWLELGQRLTQASLGSLGRLLAGLALGLLSGSLLGALMATWPLLDRLLGSLVHPLRQMPLFGWIALLGLWAGFGETSKVIFIGLAVSYTMTIAAYQGVRAVPPRLDEVARVYQLGWGKRLRVLLLPAILPAWLGGLRIALAVAWSATIGSEILMGASAAGLGGFIWGQREVGRFDLVLLGTALIGTFAVLSDFALRQAEQRLRRWLRGY
ncbi:ABC transporter permease subunit [Pseudomonas sp. BN415]|uniref:ABC transporter permease n=1 Tax=Pseudomonas sp. BN415 TaxID=2567889 RepID=UPI0024541FF5|nr:ABC transporter permease subunit [Pseudomonas sp. BN415]MDH4581543.1 ABC transporter permease subunit [Pseudomonas sp. BN415]